MFLVCGHVFGVCVCVGVWPCFWCVSMGRCVAMILVCVCVFACGHVCGCECLVTTIRLQQPATLTLLSLLIFLYRDKGRVIRSVIRKMMNKRLPSIVSAISENKQNKHNWSIHNFRDTCSPEKEVHLAVHFA